MTPKLAFEKTLKGILHKEDEDKLSHECTGINNSHQMSQYINESRKRPNTKKKVRKQKWQEFLHIFQY
jgi:hypothetical protein